MNAELESGRTSTDLWLMEKDQEQLVDLQSRLAFQENTLNQLDGVVLEQQRQLEQLKRAMAVMAQRLGSLEQATGQADGEGNQPPPHY